MAGPRPERMAVRMYQVGFGDCFLLSFSYRRPLPDGRAARHVLVDFGSTHAPLRQRVDMAAIAAEIGDACEGKLDVVVATHRHRDHISGFAHDAAAATIEGLEPTLVVQPWTEDPRVPADATGPVGPQSRRLLRALRAGDEFAAVLASRLGATGRGLPGEVAELAADQLRNAEAVGRLNRWATERDGEYLHAGAASKIEAAVPGVRVDVLGPPTVEQHPEVVNQRARDPEYWMLYQALVASGVGTPGVADDGEDTTDDEDADDLPGNHQGPPPEEVIEALEGSIPPGAPRWLSERLRRQQLHSVQRIVRTLDDALNNTSLILLLSVGRRRLLFPGDAQIENWRYTLDRLPQERSLKRKLAALDLYKVGHHGSRNATPRSLVGLWDDDRQRVALLSTRAGVHGKTEATAVPRSTLVAALAERSHLYTTEGLPKGGSVVLQAEVGGKEPFAP